MIGCRVDTFIHTFSRQTADFILKSDAQHSNLVSMAMCHSPPCCEVLCLALCAFLLKHQHHLIGSFKIKWLLKLESVRPTRPESQPFAHLQVIKKIPRLCFSSGKKISFIILQMFPIQHRPQIRVPKGCGTWVSLGTLCPAPTSATPQPPNRHSYGNNFKILCGPALKFHQVFHLKVEVTETRTREWLLVNGLICCLILHSQTSMLLARPSVRRQCPISLLQPRGKKVTSSEEDNQILQPCKLQCRHLTM